ncbi:hypothetical protein ThidrDRAFT_0872 [Thiorhodococcus drewsii AZ1]|uniref:Uncharacterized protein n=1 Tax=Thiorhodococcus drewsii AZ1 TaxID=765913 RepID=G2DXG2_9GAMM|nr:hypothetical protein [Thiorhodococcus drewsii]EGV33194.1 hypothetical protein ThidrDRAFT_0872 [Thiorhodococcus drewsii AZ1]
MDNRSRSSPHSSIAFTTYLRLRPYGDRLLTPAVSVWLGFAWVLILLMASLEGVVWGLIGASIVPHDTPWMRPLAGLFMFALMFSVIWIVDASLIMSERPMIRARRWNPNAERGLGALLRWWIGILARLAIVAVSLYVTAPFLGKLIRADDIATYHQRQVERYQTEREARLQSEIARETRDTKALYTKRTAPIEAEIARLNRSLATERERQSLIEQEFAPVMEILRQDLAGTQKRIGDEILGRDGRPAGRGREARKWEANAERLAQQLKAKQAELDQQTASIAQRIEQLEKALRERTEELERLRQERQSRLERIAVEVAARQVEAAPPQLTFAARSLALQALRDRPEEHSVPHFETVEGFAQAALGVLFFSLIAIKLFEPPSVRAYFSETIQMQYRKYLEGGLADIPGFELPEEPSRRLNSAEFVRLWSAFERDPASFYQERQSLIEVRAPLRRFLTEQALEQEALLQRMENLREERTHLQRRRDYELAALDRELAIRTDQLQAKLANETKALHNQRRIELASEIQQAREDWNRSRTQQEAELRQREEALALEQEAAREEWRLRERELANLHARGEAETRQSELAKQLAHAEKLAELELKRKRERDQMRLKAMRGELARLRALEGRQGSELQTLRETERKLNDQIASIEQTALTLSEDLETERAQLTKLNRAAETKAAESGRKRRFWTRGENGILRDIKRNLKTLEKTERANRERLAKLNEERRTLEGRRQANATELHETETRLAATRVRIEFYEDSLSQLMGAEEQQATSTSTEPH